MQNKEYNAMEQKIVGKTLLLRDKIRKVIRNIVKTYGNLFDGHTTIEIYLMSRL